MPPNSFTLAVFKPVTELAFTVAVDDIWPFADNEIPEPADNAETTLAFVKYKLLADSITFAV